MPTASWLWKWLTDRPRKSAPADPLAPFAQLTVERLEDRRVLSATLMSGVNPNVLVDITGNDIVTVSVDNANNLIITDTDGGTADIVIALNNIDSLTFTGDGGIQGIVFDGSNPIDLAALNITTGIEDVTFQQDVIADEGGVLIDALNDVTFTANTDLLCTAGDVDISAGNDLTMAATSSITADNVGNTLSVSLSANDDLTAATIHSGLGITLTAGLASPNSASLAVIGGLTADAGSVSLTSSDVIHFTAAGDITISNGSLTVTAGTDATDTLTMSDGTVFSVNHTTASFVNLTAGGDITLGEISGTNLDVVTVTTTNGEIDDITGAETANITAHAIALRARNGIGVGPGVNADIDVDADQLAFSCTNAEVNISNIGDLTLSAVDGLTTSLGFGGGTLFSSGSLTIAMETQVGGTFSFIAGDDAAVINDLTISANITHLTGLGELTFQAGDDIVQTTGTIKCFGAPVGGLSRINFTADHEASGADGDRGGITQTGGNVIAEELQIRSFDAVSMDQGNDTHILAAVVAGAGQSFTFRDINNLTVDRVPNLGGVIGLTTNGGDVALQVDGDVHVLQTINTQGGTGGVVTVRGGVLDAALIAGAGDITILSNSVDLVINANQTAAAAMVLSAPRDVIINAVVTTSGARSDVTITADADNNGIGGAWITTAGQIVSAADITITGSDVFATASSSDGIRIDADGVNDQLLAAENITLQHQTASPAGADIVIDGRVHSTGGNLAIDARDQLLVQSGLTANVGDVTLHDALVLTGDLQITAGGDVLFESTIDDDALGATSSALVVVGLGTTTFTSAVGSNAALTSLVSNGGGITEICGGSVTTILSQHYAEAVVLCANTVLTSTNGGVIQFQGTVDGDGVADRSLTVNTTLMTDFLGVVGGVNALASLTTDTGGITIINAAITTVGAQSFGDAVMLTNAAVLTSTAAGNVTFFQTVDGPHALTVNTAGMTDFRGAVGNTQALAGITTNAAGTTRIAGGIMKTFGAQTYGDDVTLATATVFSTTANAATGANIFFQSTVSTAGNNLRLDAGTQGDLTFAAAVTGGGTLLVQRADVQQFAAVEVDALTIQSATTSVTFHGAVTVTNSANINSSGTITQENTFFAGQNVQFTANGAIAVLTGLTAGDDVTLTSTGGAITLTGTVIATNGDLVANAATTLSATHSLTAGTSVVLTSTAGITLGANADISTTVNGGFVTINGPLITGADILTNNGAITLTGPVTLRGNVTWDSDRNETGGAAITVNGTINTNGSNFTLDAGTNGNLSLQAAVSGGGHLLVEQGNAQTFAALNVGQLTIQQATTSVLFAGPVTVTTTATVNSNGTITQNGTFAAGQNSTFTAAGVMVIANALSAGNDVTLTSTASTITLTGAVTATNGDLVVNAATTLSATQALTAGTSVVLTSIAGTTLGANADISTTALGGFVTINGSLRTAADILTNNGIITFNGPVTLTGNVVWDSDRNETGGAAIIVPSAVATNGNNLTIDAGTTGDLTFQSTVTGGGSLVILQGNTIAFQNAVAVANLTIQEATTAVTFAGPVTVTQSASVHSSGAITSNQAFSAGNQISLFAGTVLTLAETADLVAGSGGVILNGPQINTAAEITTNSGNVSMTGAVVLTGDVTINTGAAGSVLVTGTVNAQAAFATSLFLSTGTGDISITRDVGNIAALNAVQITTAKNVTFGGAITADHLLQQAGTGTTTVVGAVNMFGALGIQLTTEAIEFAAGTSSMDSHGHPITLTADAITLPTTFTRALSSTVTLQTLNATTTIGLEDDTQDLNFTDAQLDTIQTQQLIIGSATQTGGISVGVDGAVSLDEHLTLLTAGSVGVFGPLSLNGSNDLLLTAGNDIRIDGSVTTAGGRIAVRANDDITMGATGLVTSTAGDVLLLADANGDANGTGGGITMADGARIVVGAGTLSLQADESITLGQLTSNNTTANAIRVISQHGGIIDGGDRNGPNIVTTSNTAVVTLLAEDGIGSQTGLAADAAIETQVAQLIARNSTAGAVQIDEVDAIALLELQQSGPGNVVVTAGGTMTVAAGPGVQSQGGNITLVTTGPVSDLVLVAGINSRGGDLVLQVASNFVQGVGGAINTGGGDLTETVSGSALHQGLVNTSGGNVQIGVGEDFTQNATAAITTANGNLAITAGGAFVMQDGAFADTGNGTIALQAGNNVTLGQIRTTNATGNAVSIRSLTGAILDGGNLLGPNIVANAVGAVVTLQAATGIGSPPGLPGLDTQIHSLVATNTGIGDIVIHEADSLQVHAITQMGLGNVAVRSMGDLTLVAGQPGVSTTAGTILLNAVGPTANLVVQSTVQSTTGNIQLVAANSITLSAAAQVLSQAGNVSVVADADLSLGGNGGAMTMADGALINAGRGVISVKADGDITLGRLVTTTLVSLTTTSGGIIDGGDTGGANIVSSDLVIRAITGVGNTNVLETAVHQLAISNAISGSIRIDNNTGGLLIIGFVEGVLGITNAGNVAGNISVVNHGAMAVNGAVRNLTGGDIFLQAAENGPLPADLIVNSVITAVNGNGSIELQAGNNLVINDSGEDVDISVVNGGKILGNAVGDVIINDNVVIQTATGAIANVNPVLINVQTPQITALGIGTITMTVQRPFEIGTVIVIDWGDGNVETFVVTEANQLTLVFEHRYLGPPDPLEPAKDIPLQITVLAPGFTSGAMSSNTSGTQQVTTGSYVPNLQFFAHGQAVTPTSFGPLNETVLNTVFKTPGEGLATFAFDLTPAVVYLTFPEAPKVDVTALSVPQPPSQTNLVETTVTRTEELLIDERVVLLEVFSPDGQLQERVTLSEDVLDNLDAVVRNLPDGHYRFVLREPGESRVRLLQEFDVRQGRIVGGNDDMGDRPPSQMMRPTTLPTEIVPPADALQPANVTPPGNAQMDAAPTVVLAQYEAAPSRWGVGARLLRKHANI